MHFYILCTDGTHSFIQDGVPVAALYNVLHLCTCLRNTMMGYVIEVEGKMTMLSHIVALFHVR